MIAWQEGDLEVLDQLRLARLERRDLLSREVAHLIVGLRVAHLARAGQLGPDVVELPEGGDDRLQASELAAQRAQLVGVGVDLGGAELGRDVVVLTGERGQLGVET
jgi:hypothetical protein